MKLDLNNWETRLVLEALSTLDHKWTTIIEAAVAKGDDDTAADYGNDSFQLGIVHERIKAAAVAEFGSTIKGFSPEPAHHCHPTRNGEHEPRPR
jgi:hypothetical protein